MSFLRTYQGQQKTKGIYGNDYYSEEELPLLNKIIELLPTYVQIIDNGNCIVFIEDNTSLAFDKELFDIDIQNEKNNFAWTYFYDVMFEKTNILEKETINLFSNIYDDLASILPKLPNYKLYLIVRKLRTMLSHSEYINNLISNKIELYYSKINKKLGKDHEYRDLVLDDKLSKLYNLSSLDDDNNNINITIEEIMFLLKNGNINKYQLIDILKNDEKSINVLQSVLLSLIDYYLSDNKIISFFNQINGSEIVEEIQTLQSCHADVDLMDIYLSSEMIFIYQKISFNNQIEL